MPYVRPASSPSSSTVVPLPLPLLSTSKSTSISTSHTNTSSVPLVPSSSLFNDEQDSENQKEPNTDLLPSGDLPPSHTPDLPDPSSPPHTIRSLSHTLQQADLTPSMLTTDPSALASNFASLGLGSGVGGGQSDTVIPRLRDQVEGEMISIGKTGEEAGMELRNLDDVRGGIKVYSETETKGSIVDSNEHPTPELVSSHVSSSSLTSLDTPTETETDSELPSPLAGDELSSQAASGDEVVIASESEQEDDPRVMALNKYKEGLYVYTRGLWLEAKSSSQKTEKRRASGGTLGGSGVLGQKQSGMERLAAKKALARRLNA